MGEWPGSEWEKRLEIGLKDTKYPRINTTAIFPSLF